MLPVAHIVPFVSVSPIKDRFNFYPIKKERSTKKVRPPIASRLCIFGTNDKIRLSGIGQLLMHLCGVTTPDSGRPGWM